MAKPVPAPTSMMINETFQELPFGGHAGEFLDPSPPPPQQIVETFVIEPPDWEAELAANAQTSAHSEEQADGLSALDRMRLTDDGYEPPPLGPLMVTKPLVRPQIPEVDWRAEELQRAQEGTE